MHNSPFPHPRTWTGRGMNMKRTPSIPLLSQLPLRMPGSSLPAFQMPTLDVELSEGLLLVDISNPPLLDWVRHVRGMHAGPWSTTGGHHGPTGSSTYSATFFHLCHSV